MAKISVRKNKEEQGLSPEAELRRAHSTLYSLRMKGRTCLTPPDVCSVTVTASCTLAVEVIWLLSDLVATLWIVWG